MARGSVDYRRVDFVRMPRQPQQDRGGSSIQYLGWGFFSVVLLYAGLSVVGSLTARGFPADLRPVIKPYEQQFREECASKTSATYYDGTLARIVEGRDAALEESGYEGPRERWICHDRDGDGRFAVEIVKPSSLAHLLE